MLPGQRFVEDLLTLAFRGWLMVGILLKVTRVRDRFDGLSLVYYSTPWPALAFAFLLLAIHFWRRGKGHPVRRYLAFMVVALFTWVATSWQSHEPDPTPRDLRVVQWNVDRPVDHLPAMARWLRAQDADILCLSEAEPEEQPARDLWRAELPDYEQVPGPMKMLCLVRGEVVKTNGFLLAPSSYAMLHDLRVRGRRVTLLQVDIIALPERSRGPALRKVAEVADKYRDGELLIVGDFNTPRESAHLDALRGAFRNAFEAAGNGLSETWPSYAPAQSIDQIWAGRAWQPLTCWHGWTWRTDHRPVVADFARKP